MTSTLTAPAPTHPAATGAPGPIAVGRAASGWAASGWAAGAPGWAAVAGGAPGGAAVAGGAPRDEALVATVSTPIGPFTVVADDTGADDRPIVIASGWTDDVDALLPQVAAGLRPTGLRAVPEIRGVTEWVTAYHEGELGGIDSVPVRQDSGPFLETLWDALRTVAPGAPVTYTELAARAGRIRAARAAGSACARNAAALFVPCHRVVPAGGGVGGFRWGPEVKRWLLAHEEQNA